MTPDDIIQRAREADRATDFRTALVFYSVGVRAILAQAKATLDATERTRLRAEADDHFNRAIVLKQRLSEAATSSPAVAESTDEDVSTDELSGSNEDEEEPEPGDRSPPARQVLAAAADGPAVTAAVAAAAEGPVLPLSRVVIGDGLPFSPAKCTHRLALGRSAEMMAGGGLITQQLLVGEEAGEEAATVDAFDPTQGGVEDEEAEETDDSDDGESRPEPTAAELHVRAGNGCCTFRAAFSAIAHKCPAAHRRRGSMRSPGWSRSLRRLSAVRGGCSAAPPSTSHRLMLSIVVAVAAVAVVVVVVVVTSHDWWSRFSTLVVVLVVRSISVSNCLQLSPTAAAGHPVRPETLGRALSWSGGTVSSAWQYVQDWNREAMHEPAARRCVVRAANIDYPQA